MTLAPWGEGARRAEEGEALHDAALSPGPSPTRGRGEQDNLRPPGVGAMDTLWRQKRRAHDFEKGRFR